MRNKIFKNYMYNLIYQILIIVLPIITTPYLSRVLGVENLGIYGYTVSIVTYFTLACAFGITKYGQREVAYVQNDKEKYSKVFWELSFIKLISVIAFSIIFVLAFCIQGDFAIYYRILLFEIIAVFFDITWFFQGMEDFKKVVIRNLIIKIVAVICIFAFVKSKDDLMYYFIIYVLSTLIGNISLWINLKKYVQKPSIDFKQLKKHFKPMFSLFIPQIATSIYTILDKTMLGTLANDISEVGYYEQSQKIIKIALTLVTAMSIVMMPRISNMFSNKNNNKIEKYMNECFQFNWFLGIPISFGIAAIAPTFVPWFFGPGYDKISSLLILVCPIVVIISFSTTIGTQYLVSIKKQNIQTISVIVGAIVNVLLNIILISVLNSLGAVIATIVAELVITTIEIVYVVKKKMITIKSIFDNCLYYILSGIIMFVVVRFVQGYMNLSIISTITQIIIGGVIYIAILYVMKNEFVHNAIDRMLNFKRKQV